MTAAATPRSPAPRRRRWWIAAVLVVALPAAAAAAAAAAAWLLRSESGLRWALAQVPGLEAENVRGSLAGGHIVAERLRWAWNDGRTQLELRRVELQGLEWSRLAFAPLFAHVTAEAVKAQTVTFDPGPPSEATPSLPASLRLPVELQVAQVQIEELRIGTAAPVRAIRGAVHLAAQGGAQHRLSGLQFAWDRVAAADGQLSVDTDAPFALDARIAGRAAAEPAWTAEASARGPLAQLDLQGTLRGQVETGRTQPALDARVQLRPLDAWPLGPLDVSLRALDLSALWSGAPATRLEGRAAVVTTGARAPVKADVTVVNAMPGRWDAARLPFRRLQASLLADQTRPGRYELPAFELVLADGPVNAGRWQGRAVLDGTRVTADSRLVDVTPQRLDARAPSMRLSGPLALTVDGVPLEAGARRDALVVGFRGQFEGLLEGSPLPAALTLDGNASTRRIELRTLVARAGDAQASGTATLSLVEGSRWQLKTEGRLDRFDPLPWFPGPEGSAWRRGPHLVNAQWQADLALPERSLRLPPVQWLQSLQGEGELRLLDSRLAGVPARGRLRLQRDPAAAADERSRVSGSIELGRNVALIEGVGDPASAGDADRWQLELRAPALAELAPLARLHPASAEYAPRAGTAEIRVRARGRWPAMRSDGDLSMQALQAGAVSVRQARAAWKMGSTAASELDVTAEVAELAFGTQRVDALRVQARGTPAAHRIAGEVAAPVLPPAWLERALGLRSGRGTRLLLDGEGGWAGDPAGGGTWRGRLHRLSAAVWSGTPPAAPGADPTSTWFDSSDLQGELRFDDRGSLAGVTAPAGRAVLAGGIPLQWSGLRWRADGARANFELRAEIEPFAVAPVLQRLQTGGPSATQWGGDLRLAARLDLRAGERFDAELVLRRHDGDLSFSDAGTTPQWLGLSDVDFSLVARDGTWRFTPLFTGRMLGAISGAITTETTPQARWPDAAARLDGAVGAEVPDLAVWSGWLPPGWRLGGHLALASRLTGTLGAPEYTGELRLNDVSARNVLQGVSLRDGEMVLSLKGEEAQIQHLRVRGGDGTLTASGRASFGAAAQALLDVRADAFRVLGRVDRQLVVSGRNTLTLQPDRLRLEGRVRVDSGLFDLGARDAPTLDDDVQVRRGGAAADRPLQPAALPAMLRNAAVAVDVDLGEQLRLRGRGLDTFLAGQLQFSAPGGRPAVHGTVRAERGSFAAYGQKLEIERGLVSFAGPLDGARLDILALRPNIDLRVGVAITGSALDPRVRLYSEPEMGETDKLSWLVLGRAPEGLGRTDTALLQRAAFALIAGEGEGPTGGLVRALGLDDVSVRQTDGEVRETVVSLGKQLSRRWYVGYERGVNATAGTWQLIYRVGQRFTLRAQSGMENSLDLIWTWRFGTP